MDNSGIPEPRLDLIAHIREQIERDPEGWVARRLPYAVDKIIEVANDEEEEER